VDSEKVAVRILETEGYANVRRLDYLKTCPFDIRAESNFVGGPIFVFQITMRTHQSDRGKHIRLANDLGLSWGVLYIRPSLDKYIIKMGNESGWSELNLTDLQNLKAVPSESSANQ
jgi:hypothetical protein